MVDLKTNNNIQIFKNFGYKTGLMFRLINKLDLITVNGIIRRKKIVLTTLMLINLFTGFIA